MDTLPRKFILPSHLTVECFDEKAICLVFAEDFRVLLNVTQERSIVGHIDVCKLPPPFGRTNRLIVTFLFRARSILHISIRTG